MQRVALDANLLLLLVVGQVDPRAVGRHKRLGAYDIQSFVLLSELVATASEVVTTPNALTEASNLAPAGLAEPYRTEVMQRLAVFVRAATERYVPSRVALNQTVYSRLGLTDAGWLCAVDAETTLWTDDLELYLAAQNAGLAAVNFTHHRIARGNL